MLNAPDTPTARRPAQQQKIEKVSVPKIKIDMDPQMWWCTYKLISTQGHNILWYHAWEVHNVLETQREAHF